jgi:hypothetical protein
MNRYAKDTLRWRLDIKGKLGLPPIKKKVAEKMQLPRAAERELNLVERLDNEKVSDKSNGPEK